MEYRGYEVTEAEGRTVVACKGCPYSVPLAKGVRIPSRRAVIILARCREAARLTNVCSGACNKHAQPTAKEQ